MPILDDRGRLFGRVNLIDAAVVVVVLALIPLAYVSWLFFRTPQPKIETATPSSLRAGLADQRVQLTGQHLRPFLRVFAGKAATKYLFVTPNEAEVQVPALPPGAYDLVLYDETKEIGRQPKALTIVGGPATVITGVTPGVLEFTKEPQVVLVKGERLPPSAKAAIGPFPAGYSSQSPGTAEVTAPPLAPGTFDLVLSNEVQELARIAKAITVPSPSITSINPRVFDTSRDGQRVELRGRHFQPSLRMFVGWKEVGPQFLSLEVAEFQLPPMPAGSYDLAVFDPAGAIEYVRYKRAITVRPAVVADLNLRVRFIVRPEVLAVVKQTHGDPPAPGGPRLLSYQVGQELRGTTKAELIEGPVVIVDGVVRVPAIRKPDGWQFDGQALRAGGPFVLRAQNFQLHGEILSIEPPSARAK